MTEKELHLIDKSALVAEMEKRIKGLKDCHADAVAGYAGEIFGLERLLSFIDTLETKEVDLNRESAWKPADGDDLPEIDREVIALLENGKVVFAHRPPEYWNGKNIITNKITRYEPIRYDKGCWNQSNVKWWLDLELPKMEE